MFQHESRSHAQNQTLLASCSDQLGCFCVPPRCICASSTEQKCETWLHVDESSHVRSWCRASLAPAEHQPRCLLTCQSHCNAHTQFLRLIISHLLPPLQRNPQSPSPWLPHPTTLNYTQTLNSPTDCFVPS